MTPLLAEVDNSTIALVIQTLSALLLMALTALQLYRGASGKDSERQIEPTEMHAMNSELKMQTLTLNKLDRESGAMKAVLDVVKVQVDGLHTRTGAISRDLAATSAKVDGLENREGRRHA